MKIFSFLLVLSMLLFFTTTAFSQGISGKLENKPVNTLTESEKDNTIIYTKDTTRIKQLPFRTLEENLNILRTEFGHVVNHQDSIIDFNIATKAEIINSSIYNNAEELKSVNTANGDIIKKATILGQGEYILVPTGRSALSNLHSAITDRTFIIPNNSGGDIWYKTDSLWMTQGLYSVIAYHNVKYGDGARQKIDLWVPQIGTNLRGVFLYFHGGGFNSGDEDYTHESQQSNAWNFPEWRDSLLNAGIAFASASYTYSQEDTSGIRACLNDAISATQFIIDHADVYRYDATSIFLAGNSAGAYLAAHTGLNGGFNQIDGIICLNGFSTLNFETWTESVFDTIPPNLSNYELTFQDDLVDMGGESKIEAWLNINYSNYHNIETQFFLSDTDLLSYLNAGNIPAIYWANTLEPDTSPINFQNMRHHPRHAAYFEYALTQAGGSGDFFFSPDGMTLSVVDFIIREVAQ